MPAGCRAGLELDPSLQQPFYYIPGEDAQRPRPVCQTIVQDVVVMKTGNFPCAAEAGPGGSATTAGGAGARYRDADRLAAGCGDAVVHDVYERQDQHDASESQ